MEFSSIANFFESYGIFSKLWNFLLLRTFLKVMEFFGKLWNFFEIKMCVSNNIHVDHQRLKTNCYF